MSQNPTNSYYRVPWFFALPGIVIAFVLFVSGFLVAVLGHVGVYVCTCFYVFSRWATISPLQLVAAIVLLLSSRFISVCVGSVLVYAGSLTAAVVTK